MSKSRVVVTGGGGYVGHRCAPCAAWNVDLSWLSPLPGVINSLIQNHCTTLQLIHTGAHAYCLVQKHNSAHQQVRLPPSTPCRLGLALAIEGHKVTLLDLYPPQAPLPESLEFMECDVRDLASLQRCLAGAGLVFHVASYGMSGRQSLQHRLIEEVNIQGGPTRVLSWMCYALHGAAQLSLRGVVQGPRMFYRPA
jgi:hypothetical protein